MAEGNKSFKILWESASRSPFISCNILCKGDNRSHDKIQTVYFDFNEQEVNKFLRIDGNHRLSAVNSDSSYKDTIIPFCLLFFNGTGDTDKFCRALFHNINTKQIPLKTEQNLKVIIEGKEAFSDDVLKNDMSFGLPYYCTRKLCNSVNLEDYPLVNKFIGDSKYTYFVDVFGHLMRLGLIPEDESAVFEIRQCITDINTALDVSRITQITENIAVLGAMTVYKMQNEDSKYDKFLLWVSKNNIWLVKRLHINDVINIFDEVYKNIPKKVFLARWYPAETDKNYGAAKHRLNAIKSIVEGFGLELIDIGTQEGGTFDIRSAMYNEINEAHIFIADLTGSRPNVMVEVGYALNKLKCERMIFYFEPLSENDKPPFDLNGFKYVPISQAADMTEKIPEHIKTILDDF
jgi:hypothetical protein